MCHDRIASLAATHLTGGDAADAVLGCQVRGSTDQQVHQPRLTPRQRSVGQPAEHHRGYRLCLALTMDYSAPQDVLCALIYPCKPVVRGPVREREQFVCYTLCFSHVCQRLLAFSRVLDENLAPGQEA